MQTTCAATAATTPRALHRYDAEYYTGVARRATEAGAHMIAVKDMAGLLKPNGAGPLMEALRAGTDLPIHFHTHATSAASLATALRMTEVGCDVIDVATASLADATSQPSMNAFVASLAGAARDPGIDYLSLEPLDMHWSRVRDLYEPFECGMKSGSARVFDHEIPGGQYTNLMVQCKAMGLWSRWEVVLDMYRDVNQLLGNVVKVTPSSKAVGDFALYLITKNLSAQEVVASAPNIDFPESVFELMEGRLGFPHRGFPKEIQEAVLKGAMPLPTGERSSAALPPADFGAEAERLSAAHGGRKFEETEVIASILYPKVFADYTKHGAAYGAASVRALPTHAFWYGMTVDSEVNLSLSSAQAREEFRLVPSTGTDLSAPVELTVRLDRVGPKKRDAMRTLEFTVSGVEGSTRVKPTKHKVEVADNDGAFVFDGPMADASDAAQLGAPMLGVVEKVHVSPGQSVAEGDVIATVSAMKMEVHIKAPFSGAVSKLEVEVGDKVVEGALLSVLSPA
jgi:pyruvate carboxylase